MTKSFAAIAFAVAALTTAPAFAQPITFPPLPPGVSVQPPAPPAAPGATQRIVVPSFGCQSAAHASWVVFQQHEANQLCSRNPWSSAPVRCVEALQNFSIPVWQAVGICMHAR